MTSAEVNADHTEQARPVPRDALLSQLDHPVSRGVAAQTTIEHRDT